MNSYPFNQSVRLTTTFSQAGTAYDPASIVLKTCTPGGVITTYTYGTDAALQKDSTGTYHVDVTLVQAGIWTYRWEGTSNVTAASETQMYVQATVF